MTTETQGPPEAVDRAWASRLGVDVDTLRRREVVVIPHGPGLAGYAGTEILCRVGGACVVSAPSEWQERLRAMSGHFAVATLPETRKLPEIFGDHITLCVGPSYQGYVDASLAGAAVEADRRSRMLTEADREAFDALERACPRERWEVAHVDPQASVVCGCSVEGRMVAVASLRTLAPGVGDPCVLTLPDYSGRGYGTSVVAALLREAFRREVVVLYQTLEANAPAVALAKGLGFRRYGRKLAVRLRPSETSREPLHKYRLGA